MTYYEEKAHTTAVQLVGKHGTDDAIFERAVDVLAEAFAEVARDQRKACNDALYENGQFALTRARTVMNARIK